MLSYALRKLNQSLARCDGSRINGIKVGFLNLISVTEQIDPRDNVYVDGFSPSFSYQGLSFQHREDIR